MKISCITIVVLLIVATGCNDRRSETSQSSSEPVREIDKIRLTDMQGKAISLKQYSGKTVFINIWATWCKPCVEEIPSIKEAENILQERGIIFLMASEESPDQIIEFSNTHNFKLNYVRIENSEEMNIRALPTTFIFNGKGDMLFSETGVRKWNEKNNIDTIIKIANQK
jgi:thiol-disulfide isomerase/thioredoxin